MRTGIVFGRFSGPHLGHVSLLKKSLNENDETYLVIVTGKKSSEDKERNPLSFEIKKEVFEYSLPNVKVVEWPNAYIPDLLEHFNITDEVIIYCGGDRVEGYKKQLVNHPNVMVVEIDRGVIETSGTQIRNLIRDGKSEYARELMPDMSDSTFKKVVDAISTTGIKDKIKEMWNRINDKYNKNR